MVQSLEQYVAEATQAYQPTQTAIQNQINALSGQLATTNEQINKNYAQQQAGLNRQRNMAAETASMQAAGSGGSFGGAANIANRKYYDQQFVPAQTQLQTNQANELERARQENENQRLNYQTQLANLETQGRQSALNQYYAAKEAEESRKAQIAAAKASNPYQYLDDGYGSGNSGVKTWDFGNGYKVFDKNGQAVYTRNGSQITRGQFLEGTRSRQNTQWNLWNDIWNSGTRTDGIGSDTIQAYSAITNIPALKYTSQYGYLYK